VRKLTYALYEASFLIRSLSNKGHCTLIHKIDILRDACVNLVEMFQAGGISKDSEITKWPCYLIFQQFASHDNS
jgi:hypothetical protein